MTSISSEEDVLGRLVVHYPDGSAATVHLRDGQTLSVGTDDLSDIYTPDDTVAATHCVLSVNSGIVFLRDCYSAAGTFVNGETVREVRLTDSAEITVGATRLSLSLNKAQQPAISPPEDTAQCAKAEEPVDATSESDESHNPPHDTPSPFQVIDDLQYELAQARAEIQVLESRLVDATSVRSSATEEDPYQAEMIQLLQAEVLDLQAALAENEQAADSDARVYEPADCLPTDEAEGLVTRLEELLAELDERDHQVATLTELLNSAEETSRAEKEEREQIDNWLSELEQRFGSREQEWQAEREQLQQALADMTAERNRAELAVNADTSNTKLEACQQIMAGLREAAEEQREKLRESEDTIADLRKRLESVRYSQTREEQMLLAEEKAEIARQKQELETARQRATEIRQNDATLKMQAFRQHLNEIHEQEQREKEERKLSNRIARLWRRMDG